MAVDQQTQSPLFSLPWEVRDAIYGYLLAYRYTDFELTTRPGHLFLDNTHINPLPPAMLACKRLYRELRPAVHHSAALRASMFEFGKRVGFAHHGTLRVERLRTLHLVVAMEHANWNSWLPFTLDVLQRAANLREVVLDWEPRRARPGAATEAAKLGYLAQHERRMEQRFLKILAGIKGLERLRIHGVVPEYWVPELAGMTDARIVHCETRWWREDARADIAKWPAKPAYAGEHYSFAMWM